MIRIPWFKVDDALSMHPKAFAAGNAALGLWVRAGSWSMQHLTDGHIPTGVVAALGGEWDDAAALVNAGLWGQANGGYQFHDWGEYQPTREQILAERAKTRERVEKHRANKTRSDVGNAVTSTGRTHAPSPSQSHTHDSSKTSRSQSLDNRARDATDELSAVQQGMASRADLDVERIRGKVFDQFGIRLSLVSALALGNHICSKPKEWPNTPTPYVLGSITRNPAEVEKHIYDSGLT